MSATLTVDGGETLVRQPRRDRAERHEQSQPETTIEITPTEALADSRSQLQAKDREVADARRAEREARQRQQAAEIEVQQARVAQVSDRQVLVGQAMETAKVEQASARTAMKNAQEMGDAEGMAAAVEALSGATYRFSQASGELEYLKAQARVQPRPQPTQSGRSPDAQRWLDEHPRFNSDKAYQGRAIVAHNDALAAGLPDGSREYVEYIERELTSHYGEGHGDIQQEQQPMNEMARAPRATALPPSRGAGGQSAGGGWKTVETELGPLLVQERSDGTRGIRFPNPKVQSDFEEGAMLDKRASHSPEAFRRALGEYVNDHIEIAREIANGGTGDLVRGDGRTYGRDDK